MHIPRAVAAAMLGLSIAAAPTLAVATPHTVTGGGWFLYAGSISMQFGFSGVLEPNGSASGSFHHFYTDDVGTYEMWGDVTCLAFDTANGRSWVGGVLTKVITNDPEFPFRAGDDAWFRVLDSPDGDRSTAMGFVGIIPSSQAYCDLRIWPDGNARTHPVTRGEITVR